jgi:hypothetical protein
VNEDKTKKGAQIHHYATNVPDAGPLQPTALKFSPNDHANANVRRTVEVPIPTNVDLTAPVPKAPQTELEARQQFIFNTQDHLIDPRIQYQWSLLEMQKQMNSTAAGVNSYWRNGTTRSTTFLWFEHRKRFG